ncbi:hypothetical protein SRABI04_02230 [Chryseobacterium sp. Bi04]|nr:hypothetical protein SRABI04_02230 [Chryseobacterium sp. Bi04]
MFNDKTQNLENLSDKKLFSIILNLKKNFGLYKN